MCQDLLFNNSKLLDTLLLVALEVTRTFTYNDFFILEQNLNRL